MRRAAGSGSAKNEYGSTALQGKMGSGLKRDAGIVDGFTYL